MMLRTLIATLLISLSTLAFAAEPVSVTKVNINTATIEQLATLDGIGKSKAEAIVAYRTQIGGFKDVNELTMVKGIGSATVNKNKERIVLK